jgi:tetratricopeptide (TPR) repeat protein
MKRSERAASRRAALATLGNRPGGGAVAAGSAAVPSPRIQALTLALLAAATCAVFAGVLRNGWVTFDDPRYVYENPHVNQGLKLGNVLWFLTHAHGENWHPLTSWSHMLDVQLFGLAPMGPHAVNLALHALNAVLLVLVLYRLTGAWWRSLAVGALFALHPLRVESVAWVSERKDVLSGLLFLLTLEAYRRWAARPGGLRHSVLIVVFVLGLMAKPMLVTVPFVLVLLDVWPLGRWRALGQRAVGRERGAGAPARPLLGLLAEKWPLFALAASSSVVTFFVQREGGAVIPVEKIPPVYRLVNALLSYWRYAAKTFWPDDLAVLYPFPRTTSWNTAAAAAAGLVAVTAALLLQARKRPYLTVGWLWYLGMLVPVIGLVQVGSQAYADRYTYLPAIGLLVALVWFAGDLVSVSRTRRAAAAIALALVLAALSAATARQVAVWKDMRTLFTHAVAVTRDNPVALERLGETLLGEGEVGPAIAQLTEAVRLAPNYFEAHNNLGSALGMTGRNDEAVVHFRAALRGMKTADIHHNLAYTLAKLGRTEEAIAEYQAALQLDPGRRLTLVLLAQALVSRGRLSEAEANLRQAVALDPADPESRRLLAATLVRQERVEDAVREYEEILRRNPDDLDALNNVAWIRATHADPGHRNGAQAVRLAERARDRSPEPEAVLYSTLAAAYAEAGRFPEAVSACERAIGLAKRAGDLQQAGAWARQLARYRMNRPFHFAATRRDSSGT